MKRITTVGEKKAEAGNLENIKRIKSDLEGLDTELLGLISHLDEKGLSNMSRGVDLASEHLAKCIGQLTGVIRDTDIHGEK